MCCFISFIDFEHVSSESSPILASAAPIQESEVLMQMLEVREAWFFWYDQLSDGKSCSSRKGSGKAQWDDCIKAFFPSDKSES